ncbi:MAG: hypothetical protein AMXMBFR7_47370 [Planctomycetota bacterium]
MPLNESIVEDASLEWFGKLGYTVGHEPQPKPCVHLMGTTVRSSRDR